MRFAGADMSIFPNYGGRFSFSPDACAEIASACREPMTGFAPIMPSPGGGMTMDRIPEIREFYGGDVVLLIGGDLHRGESLTKTAEAFRIAIE
jgi:ribulose-bisphosphate carboxylase large chain